MQDFYVKKSFLLKLPNILCTLDKLTNMSAMWKENKIKILLLSYIKIQLITQQEPNIIIVE